MNIHKNKITESEVWLRCYTAIIMDPNSAMDSMKLRATLTDKATKEFWDRFEEKGK